MIVYQRNGTKGLLLRDLKIIREINRSYYHAESYEYPARLIRLPSGKAGLIHCPVEYDILHIEDAETGQCLTSRDTKDGSDFFHSRLTAMPDGSGFCDHGWVWHPVEDVAYFSVDECLANPAILDQPWKHRIYDPSQEPDGDLWEIENAVCRPDGLIVCSFKKDDKEDTSCLRMWSSVTRTWMNEPVETEALGVLYCGDTYAFSLFDHLKLVELSSGKVLIHWPHIKTGNQRSVITIGTSIPPAAFDPASFSIAVATGGSIFIVQPQPPGT